MHIQRLAALLEARGVSVGVLNHFGRSRDGRPVVRALKRNPIRYMAALPRFSASVTHYHHGGRLTPLVVVALMLRRTRHGRKIITVHGHDLQPFLESCLPLISGVTRWSLARFDLVVAVSDEVATTLRQHLPGAAITVLPAYLPPMLDSSEAKTSHGQPENRTLVVAAYKIRPLANGDLYGLDVALGAFAQLADADPSLRLLILLAQAPRRPRARHYLRARLGLLDEHSRQRVFLKIGHGLTDNLQPGAIYLRPTRIDGDAVSIREALALGIPVVASDVVHRPHGTRLVPGYDIEIWTDVIADMLRQQPTSHIDPAPPTLPPGSDVESAVLELYAEHAPDNRTRQYLDAKVGW